MIVSFKIFSHVLGKTEANQLLVCLANVFEIDLYKFNLKGVSSRLGGNKQRLVDLEEAIEVVTHKLANKANYFSAGQIGRSHKWDDYLRDLYMVKGYLETPE